MRSMIDQIPGLSSQKQFILNQLVDELRAVPGIAAIVLGGSYASGTFHEASDLDIGLYYFEARPFSIADIRRVAENASARDQVTVTGFYEWGAWVNGGAWVHTPHGKVDFLYRNIERVLRTIAEAQEGISRHDYDQQPTHGFFSVIYLAETQICIPLHDPDGVISELKRSVEIYPPKLKEKTIADSLWSAEFTLLHARGFAAQGDVYNTVGCLTRAASNLTQALFALNGKYFQRDKKVMETIAAFPILPSGYVHELNRILAHAGETADELMVAVRGLENLWRSVVYLNGGQYEPKFIL